MAPSLPPLFAYSRAFPTQPGLAQRSRARKRLRRGPKPKPLTSCAAPLGQSSPFAVYLWTNIVSAGRFAQLREYAEGAFGVKKGNPHMVGAGTGNVVNHS